MVAGMDRKTRQWLELGATAVASAALTAFARNFISGEKKIKHRIHHPHEVGHPQFERVMSQLLGPPILDGNKVTPLRNGAQIYPAMLEGIGKRQRSRTLLK